MPLPTLDGTNLVGVTDGPRLDGMDPGFNASNTLHLATNNTQSFNIFGDPGPSGADPFGVPTQTTMVPMRLYGFRLSNTWIYTDQVGFGLPHTEVRVDGNPNTDARRYFNSQVGTDVCWLPLDEPPNDPTKNSNKLIKVLIGTTGNPSTGYGLFLRDGHVPSLTFNITNQTYSNVSTLTPTAYGAGGGIWLNNVLGNSKITDCSFSGGWHGICIHAGFYYSIHNTLSTGADAAIFCKTAIVTVTGRMHYDIGGCLWRLMDSNWDSSAAQVSVGNSSSFGQTTDSYFRIHNYGAYGANFRFGNTMEDNETFGVFGPPVVHADLLTNMGYPYVPTISVRDIVANNMGGSPLVALTGSYETGVSQPVRNTIWIERINLSDGFTVSVDSPYWEVFVKDDAYILDNEVVRLTGPGPNPASRVEYTKYVSALPSAGRFVAGTIRLFVWNPAAGGVAEYRCTGSGTAAYDNNYRYSSVVPGTGGLCQSGGTEYRCILNTKGNAPPNATYWQATGRTGVPAPTWKAVSTVSP
jgi:hypothetical protein